MNRGLNIRPLTLKMLKKNIGERCVKELSEKNFNSTGNNPELTNYEIKLFPIKNIGLPEQRDCPI